MDEVRISAEDSRPTGSAASRRLRTTGKVPGVLYGHGIDPISLAVDRRELRSALTREAGLNALLTLKVGSTDHLAMARQLQRNPVKGTIDHVDFVIVRRDEVVSAEIPIRLTGEAEKVQREDGLVEQLLFNLVIHAKPADIPNGIDVDVSDLTIGDAIRVGDLSLPSGVSTDLDPEETVVMGQASRVAADVEEAEAAEAEAAAEAVEDEGAEPGEAAEGDDTGGGSGDQGGGPDGSGEG